MKQTPKRNAEPRVSETPNVAQNGSDTRRPEIPARRKFLQASVIGGVAAAVAMPLRPVLAGVRENLPPRSPAEVPSFEFDEITIADLQDGLKSGKYTARSIAEKFLARIDQIDKHGPAVNAVIEVNPDALAIAEALDKE
jgi:amidase